MPDVKLHEARLRTVTGPGGAGKTRFAHELAQRVAPGYGGSLTTCLFATLRDPTLVMPTIARALGVREAGDTGALELVAAQLRGRRDADPRQQTLRATIEWSYELLSVDEQRTFRRLATLVGEPPAPRGDGARGPFLHARDDPGVRRGSSGGGGGG